MSRKNRFDGLLNKDNLTGERQKEQVLSGIISKSEPITEQFAEHVTEQEVEFEVEREVVTDNEEIDSLMAKRVLKEESHVRQTYLIDKKLLSQLDKFAKGNKKGFKTEVVNLGIRLVLQNLKNK